MVVVYVSRVCGLAIIDVTDGVEDGHEESIVNEQDSDVNYQESPGDSETSARPMCSSGVTEFSALKVPDSMSKPYCPVSMHAVLTVQWGC